MAVLAVTSMMACQDDPAGPETASPGIPAPSFLVASPSTTISGTTGEIVDPDASLGVFCLRYTGDPPPPGDFSHACQWGTPYLLTANPEDAPVTFEGTLDVSNQEININNPTLIGLIDHDDLEDGLGPNGWLQGAYMYIQRRDANTWRIGPSDGDAGGGEIIQRSITFTDTEVPDGILNVTFTIDGTVDGTTCTGTAAAAGCLELHVMGGTVDETITDAYGEVLGSNSADPEFSNGAIPGWDDGQSSASNVVYDLTVGPLVIGGEPADPATRADCMDGGWEDFGFRNQGQCIQFVETGKDSRGEFSDGKGKGQG